MGFMWYSPHKVLSYNCLYSFIIGNRGGGKTYSAKCWAIRDFLKNGKQFIYLRRYKTEFDDIKKFFADVIDEFPEHELTVKGKNFYVDGKMCGGAVALSTALTKKSTAYPQVNKIIFDEFVIDSKFIHYMDNEAIAFLEFYETVARMRGLNASLQDDIRVLFLSNAISVVNPYFIHFGVKPNPKKAFTRISEHMIVEIYKDEEFVKAKKSTRFGQIIAGTKYADYAIDNVFLKDNKNFVEKRTTFSKYQFSVKFNGIDYGFWIDFTEGLVHVSNDIDPYGTHKFVISNDDHDVNLMLVKSANKNYYLKTAIDAYKLGKMRFKDMTVKNQCVELFGTLTM